jgi:glutathione synthase/RimK-type ligase-like ATP-grasp enzyme
MTTLSFYRQPGYGKTTVGLLAQGLRDRGYTVNTRLAAKKYARESIHVSPDEWIIRWGTRRLTFVRANSPTNSYTLNTSGALRRSQSKGEFRFMLADDGLSPPCVLNLGDHLVYAGGVDHNKEQRYVLREARHFGGKGLHVADNIWEAEAMLRALGEGAYASPLINKDREYRVMVVGDEAAFIVRKSKPENEEVAWNHGEGKWVTCDTTRDIRGFPGLYRRLTEAAVDAVELAGLDFAAVDIMVKSTGEVSYDTYVLELNSAPSITIQRNIDSLVVAIDRLIQERS